MYVTLKLDDNGCRIHSVSDGNEEIVTNQRYVVMPWKMVTRCGANMTLKEAVKEIKACEEDRKLVSKFEAKHRDEIDEILGLIYYIDKGYVEERFPEVYKFGPERLGIHLKDKFVREDYGPVGPGSLRDPIAPVVQLTKVITNSIISKRRLKSIRAEILMRLNMLKR